LIKNFKKETSKTGPMECYDDNIVHTVGQPIRPSTIPAYE